MKEVQLYTRDGTFIETVLIPPDETPPEVVLWGSRVFVGGHTGVYWDAVSRQAFTRKEYDSMKRVGIVL